MYVCILSPINFATSIYLLKTNCLWPRYLAVIPYDGKNIIWGERNSQNVFIENFEE